MKMKRILIAATLLLGLVLAFLVGQHVVAPIRNKALGQKNENPEETAGAEQEYMLEWENQKETEENPWGTTAGIIETETGTKAALLTPGTGLRVTQSVEEDVIAVRYYIHPWVAELSDGLSFSCSVAPASEQGVSSSSGSADSISEGAAEGKTQEIQIEEKDAGRVLELELDVSQYHGTVVVIEFFNLMVDGADQDGDWLVLEAG